MTRIKELRVKCGKTQQELANYLGITRGAFANIENGLREPDIESLKKLSIYFDISVDFLICHDREQTFARHNEGKTVEPSREPWAADIIEDFENARSDEERRHILLDAGYDDNHYHDAKRLFPEVFPPERDDVRDELLVYFERLNKIAQGLVVEQVKYLSKQDEYKKDASYGDNGTVGRVG